MFGQVARCNNSTNNVFSGPGWQGHTGTTTWNAYPYNVWAKEAYNTQQHYFGNLGTSWGYSNTNSGHPYSARCVVALKDTASLKKHIPKRVLVFKDAGSLGFSNPSKDSSL